MSDSLGGFRFSVSGGDALEDLRRKMKATGEEIAALEAKEKQLAATTGRATGAVEAFSREGRGAIRDINRIGTAVEGLTKGFDGVLKTAPYLTSMLGASGVVVGGFAAVATGARVVYDEWDRLKYLLEDTAPFEAARGALVQLKEGMDAAAKGEGVNAELNRFVLNQIKGWKDATAAAKEHAEAVKQIAEAHKHLASITSKEGHERGSNLTEAITRAGGGVKVTAQMVDQIMSGLADKSPENRAKVQEEVERRLGQGLAGGDVKGLPASVRNALVDVETEKSVKDTAKLQQDQHDREKGLADEIDKRRKLIDILNEEGRRFQAEGEEKQKRERIQDLEDKKEAIQDQLQADLEGLRPGRTSQIVQGAKASLDLYQQGNRDPNVEKAQELRKKANTLLKEIADAVKKERRLIIEH
jgi:hypothetical protein